MTTLASRSLVVALLLAGARIAATEPAARQQTTVAPAPLSDATQGVVRIDVANARASGCFVGPGEVVTAADALRGRDVVRLTTVDGRMGLATVVARDKSGLALLTVHASLSPTSLATLGAPRADPASSVRLVRPQAGGSLIGRIVAPPPDRASMRVDMDEAPLNSDLGAPLVDERGRVVGIVLSIEGRSTVAATASSVGALLSKPRGPAPSPAAAAAGRPPASPSSPATPAANAESERLSDADLMRIEGEQALDRAFAALADDVDAIAAREREYELSCVGQYVPVLGCWGLAYDYCVVEKTQLPECLDKVSGIEQLQSSVRSGIAEAEERARRAGVYPGVMRDLRARYGLGRLPF